MHSPHRKTLQPRHPSVSATESAQSCLFTITSLVNKYFICQDSLMAHNVDSFIFIKTDSWSNPDKCAPLTLHPHWVFNSLLAMSDGTLGMTLHWYTGIIVSVPHTSLGCFPTFECLLFFKDNVSILINQSSQLTSGFSVLNLMLC